MIDCESKKMSKPAPKNYKPDTSDCWNNNKDAWRHIVPGWRENCRKFILQSKVEKGHLYLLASAKGDLGEWTLIPEKGWWAKFPIPKIPRNSNGVEPKPPPPPVPDLDHD